MSQDITKASKEEAQRLTDLIAEARGAAPTTKFDQMEKYREVLIRERKAGAPVRVITEALSKLGVNVSEETVRVWFKQNKTTKSTTRTKASKPVKIKPPTEATAFASKHGGTTPAGAHRPRIARDDI